MFRFNLIFMLIINSITQAIELPTWHESDIEKKEIAHQYSNPKIGTEVGYLPKLQTEEEYRDFVLSEQRKYETPLLLLAESSVHILSNLNEVQEDLKKTAADLSILNEKQNFKLKFILTEELPSKFDKTLPDSITRQMAIIILNPNKLSNQTQISYSTNIYES